MDAAGQPDVQGWIPFFLLDVNQPDVSAGLVGFSSGILRINSPEVLRQFYLLEENCLLSRLGLDFFFPCGFFNCPSGNTCSYSCNSRKGQDLNHLLLCWAATESTARISRALLYVSLLTWEEKYEHTNFCQLAGK